MTAATVTLIVGLLMRSGRLTAWIRLAATLAVILAMSALLLLVLGNALTLSGAPRNDPGTRGLLDPVQNLGRGPASLARAPVLGLGPGEFRRRDGPLLRPRSRRCLRPG